MGIGLLREVGVFETSANMRPEPTCGCSNSLRASIVILGRETDIDYKVQD